MPKVKQFSVANIFEKHAGHPMPVEQITILYKPGRKTHTVTEQDIIDTV